MARVKVSKFCHRNWASAEMMLGWYLIRFIDALNCFEVQQTN